MKISAGHGCWTPHRLCLLLLFLPLQILGEANAKIDGVRHVGGIACEGKSGKEPEEIA